MDSQTKARDLVNMLIVDGEDLEEQLEDTRRQFDDLIEARQAEIWANDPQLQQLRETLQSANHRFNANVGQGVTDPRILDPIQKTIDQAVAQIKQRQAQLGVDPSEIKVQESLNHVIVNLRNKLTREKQQIDQVLDPLQRELGDLDPVVAAMPQAQQDLARAIRDRLEALNVARTKYAKTVGDDSVNPTGKITEIQSHIADLKSRIAAREADLTKQAIAVNETHRTGELAAAQAKVAADQTALDAATKNFQAADAAYQDTLARHQNAMAAQQKKISLMDDQRTADSDLEAARRDHDEKQSAADHAFDIKPVSDDDVHAVTQSDPRIVYSAVVAGAGVLALAMLTLVSHSSGRRSSKMPQHPFDADTDSLAIP
jgi:chromosome segregation ATPase